MTHGIVTAREAIYENHTWHTLELPDGTTAAVPAGFVVSAGDVIAVITPHELRLLETYRRHVKPPAA